jgi:hypothetical protein
MGIQPFPVPEQRAKRQGNLAMLVSLRAWRERAGVSQDIAPMLDKLRLAVEPAILCQCTGSRRHDATYIDSQSP